MKEFLKKIDWKYSILGMIIPLVGYYSYGAFIKKPDTTASASFQVIPVARGDVKKTLKALGKTSVVNEQKIRFNQTGKVAKVNVKEGDTVKKDQIIAELEMSDVNNSIEQNRISYENSIITLNDLLKGNDKSQILRAQNTVQSTQDKLDMSRKSLDNLKKEASNKIASLNNTLKEQQLTLDNLLKDTQNFTQTNANDIQQAKEDYDTKKNSYDIVKKEYDDLKGDESQNINSSQSSYNLKIDNAVLDVKNILLDTDSTLTDLDAILGVTDLNKNKNDSFEMYLAAKDSSLKIRADSIFMDVVYKKNSINTDFSTIQNLSGSAVNLSTLVSVLNSTKDLMNKVIDLSDTTTKVLENSITSSSFTQSQIDSFKSTASSKRSSAQGRLSTILNDISSIQTLDPLDLVQTKSDTTLTKKQQDLQNALIAMNRAQQSYNLLLSGLDVKNTDKSISIIKAQNSITDSKNQIAQTTDSYNNQIKSSENDIKSLENQLVADKQSLTETLKGPTDANIAKAKNDIEQKKIAWDQSKKNIEKYQIIAPFDGTILTIDFKVGDNLVSDDTKYVYIQNPNLIEVSVLLDQTDIVNVRPGMPVTMEFYAYPDNIFEGSVSDVSGIPTESNGVVSYEAKVVLNTEGKTFYSGMTQTVEIVTAEEKNAITVPATTITTSGTQKTVQVVRADGSTEVRNITTGITDGVNTQVISGLSDGENVAQKTYTAAKSSSANASSSNQLRIPGVTGGGGGSFGGGGGNFGGGTTRAR